MTCHKIITKRFCTCQAESLTFWTHPDVTKWLPRGSAHVKLNHLLSKHSQMSKNHHQEVMHISSWITYILNTSDKLQNHYQEVWHLSSWITYILNTTRCPKIITKRFCTCQAESLTYWTWPDPKKSSSKRFHTCWAEPLTSWTKPDATKSSPRGSAHVELNHSLPEHSQMPQNHHWEVLHMSSWITYFLNTARYHRIITERFGTCQAESLTFWTQPDATESSPRGSAHVKLSHLLPEHSQMPQNHHQEVQHMSSWITYFLDTARCHQIITKKFCTYQAESLTYWKQTDATIYHQEVLHMSSRITYSLNIARCHKIITKRFHTCQASLTPWI